MRNTFQRWFQHIQLLLSGEVCSLLFTKATIYNQSVNEYNLDTRRT